MLHTTNKEVAISDEVLCRVDIVAEQIRTLNGDGLRYHKRFSVKERMARIIAIPRIRKILAGKNLAVLRSDAVFVLGDFLEAF